MYADLRCTRVQKPNKHTQKKKKRSKSREIKLLQLWWKFTMLLLSNISVSVQSRWINTNPFPNLKSITCVRCIRDLCRYTNTRHATNSDNPNRTTPWKHPEPYLEFSYPHHLSFVSVFALCRQIALLCCTANTHTQREVLSLWDVKWWHLNGAQTDWVRSRWKLIRRPSVWSWNVITDVSLHAGAIQTKKI